MMSTAYDLAFTEAGQVGPAMVFLHGLAASGHFWSSRVQPLAKSFRLFMPDLLGFGRSPRPRINYTIPVHIRALHRLVEGLPLDRQAVTVVGHSLGAILALEYAALHPQRVGSLVLLNLPCYSNRNEARRIIRKQGGLHQLTVSNRALAHFT